MERLHLAYAAVGTLALLIALQSRRVRRLPVSGPALGLLLGVLGGPYVLDLVHLSGETRDLLLLEGSRLLLAVSLVGVALRFPVRTVREHLRPVLLLLAVAMPLSAALTGVLGAVLLGLPVALAALLGACLCPTDPVLSSDVVTGGPAEQDLEEAPRVVLTEESGVNDGLALPLVLVALAPVLGTAVGGELAKAAYQVAVGVLVGALVGALVALALRAARERDQIEGASELVLTLLLAVTVLGAARLLKADAVLAVFVAGLAYNAVAPDEEREPEDTLDEAANRYAVIPFFALVGVVLPLDAWRDLGWPALAFAAGVLLVRRPPVVLALRRLLRLPLRDAAVLGWFGPIGVSAVFYLALSAHEGVRDPRLLAAGTVAVVASVLVHGATTVPARALYRRAGAR